MTDLDRVTSWIDGYLRAWDSNDPEDIGALFTEDARYHTEPFGPPWSGRAQIVERWLDRRDAPGEATFVWHPVVVTDQVAVIEGVTTYPEKTYSNLWVIRLDAAGRCTEFTEWWMQHPASSAG